MATPTENKVYFPAGGGQKTPTGFYDWQNIQIDDNLLNAFAQKGAQAIGFRPDSSQQQASAEQVLQKINQAMQMKLADETARLKAISPYFDISKYVNPLNTSIVMSPGEGASANRSWPTTKLTYDTKEQLAAIERAKAAAEKFQKTGKFEPYPDYKPQIQQRLAEAQSYAQRAFRDPAAALAVSKYQNLLNGTGLDPAGMAQANAAAARVGAPLPYPQGSIGNIGAGGVFTNETVKGMYSNGQLNQAGQNVLSSNSAANLKLKYTKDAQGNYVPVGSPGTSPTGQQFETDANGQLVPVGGGVAGGGASKTGVSAGGAVGGAAPAKVDPAAQSAALKVLDGYLQSGTIDSGTYQFFKQAVETWNPSQQVNYANVLKNFEQIKKSSIDPYFQEQAKQFIDSVQNNRDVLMKNRVFEKGAEEDQAKAAIEGAQENLAQSGLMFSGKAIKQLGQKSAFATEGTPEAAQSAIPKAQPFGGAPIEGEIPKQIRVAASSSQLRYEQNLRNLQRQAEARLGTSGSAGLVPETKALGGITGTLESEKKQAQASALQGLAAQQDINVAAQQAPQIF